MSKLKVQLAERSYDIVIEKDGLVDIGAHLKHALPSNKVLIISNKMVFDIYGDSLISALEKAGFKSDYFLMEDGEKAKNLATAEKIYDKCFQAKLDRKSGIIALGGGVVGDVAGFVAATYLRGVNFIQIPTTLLAQVDSSVGGKVAVNHPQGKNLIGAFYQPKLVFMELNSLKTLPERELRAGLAEVIKYGVIKCEAFFNFLEENAAGLLALDLEVIEQVIFSSCKIKSQVVALDERESGLRAILNFGHTIGHAVEAQTDYRQFRHGEAVAMGMAGAGQLAVEMGWWSQDEQKRLVQLIKRLGLPAVLPEVDTERLVQAMHGDKKNVDDKIVMVLPKKMGEVAITHEIDLKLVKQVLDSQKYA